jgi:hypothetical protein
MFRLVAVTGAVLALGQIYSSAQTLPSQRVKCLNDVTAAWKIVLAKQPDAKAHSMSAHFNQSRGSCLLIEEYSMPPDGDWPQETMVTRVFDLYEARNIVLRRHFKNDSPKTFALFFWQTEEDWREGTAADREKFTKLLTD